jgi:hypothetical protein
MSLLFALVQLQYQHVLYIKLLIKTSKLFLNLRIFQREKVSQFVTILNMALSTFEAVCKIIVIASLKKPII